MDLESLLSLTRVVSQGTNANSTIQQQQQREESSPQESESRVSRVSPHTISSVPLLPWTTQLPNPNPAASGAMATSVDSATIVGDEASTQIEPSTASISDLRQASGEASGSLLDVSSARDAIEAGLEDLVMSAVSQRRVVASDVLRCMHATVYLDHALRRFIDESSHRHSLHRRSSISDPPPGTGGGGGDYAEAEAPTVPVSAVSGETVEGEPARRATREAEPVNCGTDKTHQVDFSEPRVHFEQFSNKPVVRSGNTPSEVDGPPVSLWLDALNVLIAEWQGHEQQLQQQQQQQQQQQLNAAASPGDTSSSASEEGSGKLPHDGTGPAVLPTSREAAELSLVLAKKLLRDMEERRAANTVRAPKESHSMVTRDSRAGDHSGAASAIADVSEPAGDRNEGDRNEGNGGAGAQERLIERRVRKGDADAAARWCGVLMSLIADVATQSAATSAERQSRRAQAANKRHGPFQVGG